MITVTYLLAGQMLIRDAETNAVSIIGLQEEINATGFPAFHPNIHILAILERESDDPVDIKCELTLMLEDEILGTYPMTLAFQEKLRTRALILVQGIVIPRPGSLQMKMVPERGDPKIQRIPVKQTEESPRIQVK
jgi:hypothetical protein